MTFCLAVLLLACDDLPRSLSDPVLSSRSSVLGLDPLPEDFEPELPPPAVHDVSFIRVRGGLWSSRQFHFEATTTSGLGLSSKQEALGSAGLDVGPGIFGDRFVIFGSIEGAFGNKIRLEDGSVCLGFRDWAEPGSTPGVPQEAMIYAGPMYGLFDVTTPGFVDFDKAWGVRAGLSFTWLASRAIGITLAVEYRYIKFEVKDKSEVASGNTSVGASGVWAGLGLDLRF